MTTYKPFSWYGGKSALTSLLVSLLPAHEAYCEVFADSSSFSMFFLIMRPFTLLRIRNSAARNRARMAILELGGIHLYLFITYFADKPSQRFTRTFCMTTIATKLCCFAFWDESTVTCWTYSCPRTGKSQIREFFLLRVNSQGVEDFLVYNLQGDIGIGTAKRCYLGFLRLVIPSLYLIKDTSRQKVRSIDTAIWQRESLWFILPFLLMLGEPISKIDFPTTTHIDNSIVQQNNPTSLTMPTRLAITVIVRPCNAPRLFPSRLKRTSVPYFRLTNLLASFNALLFSYKRISFAFHRGMMRTCGDTIFAKMIIDCRDTYRRYGKCCALLRSQFLLHIMLCKPPMLLIIMHAIIISGGLYRFESTSCTRGGRHVN